MPFLLAGTTCRAMLRRAVPRRATFSPTEYEQFPFFSNLPSFWKQQMKRWRGCLSSSLPFIFLLAQQSTLRANSCARLPALLVVPARRPTSGSRGGRPVSVKPIGKQRPKMYFPVSSPSLMSKYSNGSRKNVAGPQFLLTMIYCHLAPRPPPRKFDKSQNL